MPDKELVQREDEPLEDFIERVVKKWEKDGKIEVDGEVLAVLGEEQPEGE